MMNINFPAVDETYIKQKVESGFYSNVTELVRDAVRRMREADEQRQAFLAAAQIGDEQIARGQYRVYTPELFEEIKRNAPDKVKRGHQPNPDVLP
jgi:antitoxin ParD1/3/4